MNLSILGSMDKNVNKVFKKDKALNTFKVLTINKTYIMVPSGEVLLQSNPFPLGYLIYNLQNFRFEGFSRVYTRMNTLIPLI